MRTDISGKGLETLIMPHMAGVDGLAITPNMGPPSGVQRRSMALFEAVEDCGAGSRIPAVGQHNNGGRRPAYV